MTRSDRHGHTERHNPHWIEWLTGVVSALLVSALIGWIAYEAFTRKAIAPELSASILTTEPSAGGFRVTFEIANAATTTAAAVTVVGRLKGGEDVIEESTVTVDYVPAESRVLGALIFENDPGGRQIDIRATGYTDP
jgi:uncharacterized protein (TIGR02588 family)